MRLICPCGTESVLVAAGAVERAFFYARCASCNLIGPISFDSPDNAAAKWRLMRVETCLACGGGSCDACGGAGRVSLAFDEAGATYSERLLESGEVFAAFTPEGIVFRPAGVFTFHILKAYNSGQRSDPFLCGTLWDCRAWLARYAAIDAADPNGREALRAAFACRC